jgi:hypothetical protein
MASIAREELLRLARSGAVSRLKELNAERDSIYSVFPDLKEGTARAKASAPPKASAPKAAARSGGQANRAWSAAARKAVSERMKRYWAARRAKNAKSSK